MRRESRMWAARAGFAARLLLLAGPRYSLFRAFEEPTVIDREAARDAVYERIWREAATLTGTELTRLPHGFLELRRGRSRARVYQHLVPLDDPVALRVALDRDLTATSLRRAGVGVVAHRVLADRSFDPEGLMRELGAPLVVKPARGSAGGVGVTTGVATAGQLKRAVSRAWRFGGAAVVEPELAGDVFRFLFLDCRLLDVVRRRPPSIVGDGRSSIAKLVVAENRRRGAAGGSAGVEPLTIDDDCLFTLSRSGRSPRTRLPRGAVLAVKTVTNQNRPADNQTYTGAVAAETLAACRRAVDAVGLRLAGIDVVTIDPARPLGETGGAVIEVNGTPGLHHHYLVSDPEAATRIAVPVLQAALAERTHAPPPLDRLVKA
jgi:D-alanine-D-alanine ligase-like ATP-grasp enzyme